MLDANIPQGFEFTKVGEMVLQTIFSRLGAANSRLPSSSPIQKRK